MSDEPTQLPATPGPDAPREPLLSVGTFTAAAAAIVGAAVVFGVDLSPEQTGAILALIGVVAPLVVAFVGRLKVFAPATVRSMVKAAETR